MRRLADVLLLGAAALVAGLAIVDALEPSRPKASDQVDEAVADLRDAHVRGRLVVAAPDCSRRELELPSLRARPLGVTACSVYGHPGSLSVFRGGVVWYAFAGGTTTLLEREQLDAYLGHRSEVLRAAWLGNVRYAVAYRIDGRPGETLALFERSRLVRVVARALDFDDVRTSPRGRFLAARSEQGLRLYDALGRRLPVPDEVLRADAVAWSPDERWTIAAADDHLAVFRTRSRDVAARIPVGAIDVDWTVTRR
jgi:hypothetical protein